MNSSKNKLDNKINWLFNLESNAHIMDHIYIGIGDVFFLMNDTYLTFNGKIIDKNELVFVTYLNVLFFRIT